MDTGIIYAPDCLTLDGRHIIEPCDPPFYSQCSVCFERFVLISETVMKESGIDIKIHKIRKGDEDEM